MRLQGKTAIVTGGASGIGRGLAQRFSAEGARVVIVDLKHTQPQSAAEEIAATTRGPMLGLAADVTDEEAVGSAVVRAIREYGGVDILLSNAGNQVIGAIHELAYDDWKRLLSVHLDGAFLTTRACLRHMYRSGKGGTILYMGSVHSKLASVLKAPYVTAKHGLLGLCRTVAKEGAPYGVRANVICPGFVRTPLVEKQIPEQAKILNIPAQEVVEKVMLKDTLDQQFTSVEEIGEAAVFLAEQKGLALSGQSIMVTHGWFME
ncbi:MAG: 3-hydroxybutyrate dehydrogenase [Acidobacteriaceae bacterium]